MSELGPGYCFKFWKRATCQGSQCTKHSESFRLRSSSVNVPFSHSTNWLLQQINVSVDSRASSFALKLFAVTSEMYIHRSASKRCEKSVLLLDWRSNAMSNFAKAELLHGKRNDKPHSEEGQCEHASDVCAKVFGTHSIFYMKNKIRASQYYIISDVNDTLLCVRRFLHGRFSLAIEFRSSAACKSAQ